MNNTQHKAKSLSGRIFSWVLVFTLVVIVVLGIVATCIYFFSYENEAETALKDNAVAAADYLNAVPADDNIQALNEQFPSITRYTLIATDGTVLFDSLADATNMDNHADRPEIQQALLTGEAVVSRYSETLGTDTLYAAVTLDDGNVLRLSETRYSLWAFLGDLALPLTVAFVVAVILVLLLSRYLTRRIMKPIDALDFSSPLQNDIYTEMNPLLVRIDEQQQQLKQQNRELAEAANIRRDFSSNVSHEMKTPLQVISGYAELMKDNAVDTADQQKFAGLIYDEAQSMRLLIDDVLILSRLDESAFGNDDMPVDAYRVAREVVGRLQNFADERDVSLQVTGATGEMGAATGATGETNAMGVTFPTGAATSEMDTTRETANIMGNEALFEAMLYNLVDNAIRYSNAGGSVVVEVRRELNRETFANIDCGMSPQQANLIRRGAADDAPPYAEREQVIVRVADTGVGIPEDMRDKVFERFYRVDKSRSKETGGTGLGLAIVKHVVVYHGGTVQVEDNDPQGTVFVLRFPGEGRENSPS